jgi:putative hydrolase of the HAD superfamily
MVWGEAIRNLISVEIMGTSTKGTMTTRATKATCLFVDIGGVLLSNGWDHHFRQRAAANFNLDWSEMEERHQLNVNTFEEGKLTLDDYLSRVVFYQERSFTPDQFRQYMFSLSKPCPEMIELMRQLKRKYGVKIAVVSNESRELNAHRIHMFRLNEIVDFFVSSCFVHIRKPDIDIFRLALDIAQTPAEQIVYIENTPMFVQIAEGLGIKGILHTDCKSTCAKLAAFGLQSDTGSNS